jgi:hypothetical protein
METLQKIEPSQLPDELKAALLERRAIEREYLAGASGAAIGRVCESFRLACAEPARGHAFLKVPKSELRPWE